GFPLTHHTVFFSDDYDREFKEITHERRAPEQPTVYICAQDRTAHEDAPPPAGPERLFAIVNAPPDGDAPGAAAQDGPAHMRAALDGLSQMGVRLTPVEGGVKPATPADYAALFPHTGGALYGRAPHGLMSAFQRPAARSAIKGLYLAGGSAHPGPGAPMAATSGRLAAEAVIADA
ncbi:MAG: CrtD protein, partial [Pseudomonadota bacterium]